MREQRLGWARNVNFLLDAVNSDFSFLYFHDDIIERAYTERLLGALAARPDAASVHCDMGTFGGAEGRKTARAYEGSAAERLCLFLVARNRGSPLRSMTRRDAVGGLRLATDAPAGFWANEAYLMGLIAAGPALSIPDILYWRWDKRQGSLTDGWLRLGADEIRAGLRANAAAAIDAVRSIDASASEHQMMMFCAFLFLSRKMLHLEKARGTHLFDALKDLHPALAGLAPPPGLAKMSREIQDFVAEHAVVVNRRWSS